MSIGDSLLLSAVFHFTPTGMTIASERAQAP
jgi:hypothetical protein